MTIEKVRAIAKEKYGKELTDEQAAEYAEKYGKLSDAELDSVAGGCGGGGGGGDCPKCGTEMNLTVYGWRCPYCYGWDK